MVSSQKRDMKSAKELNRVVAVLLSIIAFSINAIAADVKFRVLPPRNVIEGNKFNVTFRLENADGNGLKVSEINGCQFLYGPSESTQQSYQYVNGRTSSQKTVDYSFVYKAGAAGEYTIPAASIQVDGKTFQTDPLTFKVIPADSSAADSNTGQGGVRVDDASTHTSDKPVGKDEVFVRIIPSRTNVYEEEPIECVIKLYTKYQIGSFLSVSQPNFDGCLIDEIAVQPSLNEIEHYNGQNYMTAVLKKVLVFPQKSGQLKFNSGKYDISVVQYERVGGGFFSTNIPVEKEIHLAPGDLTINVKELPTPQPEDFTGAVGQFTAESRLSSDALRTNEAATMTITISGIGNIRYIKALEVDFPADFEQYSPHTEIDASVVGNNVKGKQTVEYTFVPQTPGDYTIPPIDFVYFDPEKKEYITITLPERNIKVAKGVGTTAGTSNIEQKDINATVTDILHIKQNVSDLNSSHSLYVHNTGYWIIWVLLIVALGGAIVYTRKITERNADIAGRRLAKAGKVGKKRLKQAKAYMTGNDPKSADKFYEELLRAMWGYIGDKFRLSSSQLTRQNISTNLSAHNVPEETIGLVVRVLDDCEMARYTPSSTSEEAHHDVLEMAEQAINCLEKTK